jgi:hypothetical protein
LLTYTGGLLEKGENMRLALRSSVPRRPTLRVDGNSISVGGILLGTILVAVLAPPSDGAQTVRVDASAGAPRIVVDGRPVRARMFWGAPGSRPLSVGTEGQEVEFEFSPPQDEPAKATMHFRFGQTPGDIWLDELHVRDLTDRART